MSWLRDHLHTFVYPNLAAMQGASWDKDTEILCKLEVEKEVEIRNFRRTGFELLYLAVNKLEILLHGNTKRLILTGRDTWFFYVAAMRRKALRNRTLFFPQINRVTSKSPLAVKLLVGGGLQADDILFDTGFMGSVFTALFEKGLPKCNGYLLSKDPSSPYQTLFSRDIMIQRKLYSANAERYKVMFLEEETPKYWRSANLNSAITQQLSPRKEFLRCAADTCLILEKQI